MGPRRAADPAADQSVTTGPAGVQSSGPERVWKWPEWPRPRLRSATMTASGPSFLVEGALKWMLIVQSLLTSSRALSLAQSLPCSASPAVSMRSLWCG